MRIYTHDQEGLLFFSPYTSVTVQPERLMIRQTLFNYTVVLYCTSDFADRLINKISYGTTYEEIAKILHDTYGWSQEKVQELLDLWLQSGVLE
jgi:hypothetical protein